VLPVALAPEAGRGGWRPRPAEIVLGTALAAALIVLVAVLLTGQDSTGPGPKAGGRTGAAAATSHVPSAPASSTAATTAGALPPVAAAAADLVGELQAGVTDGQVTQQAGQDLFNQLQQVLFGQPGQDPEQTQNQFDQLVNAYDRHLSQGDITGTAATALRTAITALGNALGVL
jgi:hypothetical protein